MVHMMLLGHFWVGLEIQEYSGYLHRKHLVMFLPASGGINHSIEFDAKQSHAAKHHKIHHEHRHRFGISLRLDSQNHALFRISCFAYHKLKTIIYSSEFNSFKKNNILK